MADGVQWAPDMAGITTLVTMSIILRAIHPYESTNRKNGRDAIHVGPVESSLQRRDSLVGVNKNWSRTF